MAVLQQTSETTAELEYAACEICGADVRKPLVARPDLFLGGDAVYQMSECQKCGVVYQYPRPTRQAIEQYYPQDYQQYTRSLRAESRLRRIDRRYGLRKRCNLIRRHVQTGRLLDVGCATGDFLSEMKRLPGWQVAGIEPNHTAAAYARTQGEVEVIDGLLNEAPFGDGTFDAITMWDVLEHVYDPCIVVREAARLLRSGGVLVVNHPNLGSLDRKIFGRFWLGYELPRHMYLFPPEMLRRLMQANGLVEHERVCLYGSHAATATSLSFIAQAYIRNRGVRNAVRSVLLSKICRLLFIPFFFVVDRYRRGSNITSVFRKI